jgi:Domain of unknown function (DUF5063)
MTDVSYRFIEAARAFQAALIVDDAETGAFARQVRDALSRLYAAAALLGPPTSPDTDDVAERAPREARGRLLREQLAARFGEHDAFVDVYDPSKLADEDVEPIERSLSSDLVEIDEDIAEAVALLEGDRVDALWDVQWAFENHWGQHAVACLRPLHQLVTYGVA